MFHLPNTQGNTKNRIGNETTNEYFTENLDTNVCPSNIPMTLVYCIIVIFNLKIIGKSVYLNQFLTKSVTIGDVKRNTSSCFLFPSTHWNHPPHLGPRSAVNDPCGVIPFLFQPLEISCRQFITIVNQKPSIFIPILLLLFTTPFLYSPLKFREST